MLNTCNIKRVEMFYVGDDGGAAAPVDTSNVSVCSDEGLDVSQQFAETVFTGSSLDSDAEEIVSGENSHLCLSLICYHQ